MRYGNIYKILILLFSIGFLALIFIKLFGEKDLNNSQPIQYTQEAFTESEARAYETPNSGVESENVDYTVETYPDMAQTIPEEKISPEAITLFPDDIVVSCYFSNSENVIDAMLPLYAQEILVVEMQKWLNEQGMSDIEELWCIDGSFKEEGNNMFFQVAANKTDKTITCKYNTEKRTWKFEVE
jgi:hypothetical protein